jgi:hypothetical protein
MALRNQYVDLQEFRDDLLRRLFLLGAFMNPPNGSEAIPQGGPRFTGQASRRRRDCLLLKNGSNFIRFT